MVFWVMNHLMWQASLAGTITALVTAVLIKWVRWAAAVAAWWWWAWARARTWGTDGVTATFSSFLPLLFFLLRSSNFFGLLLTLFLLLELMLVFLSLIPHDEAITLVHLNRYPVQVGFVSPQLLQEANGQLLASFARTKPDSLNASLVNEVLRDRNSDIEILYSMPPVAWDEDCLPRVLNTFNDNRQTISTLWTFSRFQPRENLVKVLDCFIVFAFLP